MNYNKKDLEDLYDGVAGKPVAQRRHLQVLGEDVASESDVNELILMLQDMLAKQLLDSKEVEYVKSYLTRVPYEKSLLPYLKNQNLNESTIDEGNILELIVQVLTKHNDLEAYSKYIQSPQTFSSLVERKGNLADDMAEVAGIQRATALDLINLKGTEGGRGVGKGEVAMATIFNDVKMSAGKGDLDWNGKYLEVKGTAARLGKRDRPFPGFEKTTLGRLAAQFDKTDKRIDTLVANLANEPEADLQQISTGLSEFIKAAYPHNNLDVTSDINLKDSNAVRDFLAKAYIFNYSNGEGVDYFIFINTSNTRYFGRYFIFTSNEIIKFVDTKVVKTGVITTSDLDPSIGTI